jgi:hypothetical protein
MSDVGFEKQIVPPAREGNRELAALKRKIDTLQVLYVVLFFASLAVLVFARGAHLAWAAALGGAVVVRLTRQSLVGRYNRGLAGGGPAQLT